MANLAEYGEKKECDIYSLQIILFVDITIILIHTILRLVDSSLVFSLTDSTDCLLVDLGKKTDL